VATTPKDTKAVAGQLATPRNPAGQKPAGVLFAAVLAELRTRRVQGELVWSADGLHCELVRGGRTICLIYRQEANGVRVRVALSPEQIIDTYVTDMESARLVGHVVARAGC
jgi:hypothetical protein